MLEDLFWPPLILHSRHPRQKFEDPADLLEYDAGQLETAVMLSEMVKDLVWPDFKVGAEGAWVVFRRVKERYFPRKNKAKSTLLNDESSKQE